MLHAVDLGAGLDKRLCHHGRQEGKEGDEADNDKGPMHHLETCYFRRLQVIRQFFKTKRGQGE